MVAGMLRLGIAVLLLPALGVAVQEEADAKYEAVLQKLLGTIGQISKTLETVKDEKSGQEARPELRKQTEEFRATRKKSEELAPPSPEVRERIGKKYQPEFEKARKELAGQVARVQRVPGGPAVLQEIRGVFERDAQ